MRALPTEIKQQILQELDPVSLKNAALSGPDFYAAFKGAEQLIVKSSLLTCIDEEVVPEAARLQQTWALCPPHQNQEAAIEFVMQDNIGRGELPSQLKLIDAIAMVKFHKIVRALADSAARETLANEYHLTAYGQSAIANREEIHRFQRALYRFQLYCNVVGEVRHDRVFEVAQWFFQFGSAIENEQLACIHDYIVRVVAEPFSKLVDHSVDWGHQRVPYIDSYSSPYANAIMSKGLEVIYDFSQATERADPTDVLAATAEYGDLFDRRGLGGIPLVRQFLYDDLRYHGTSVDMMPFRNCTVSELALTEDYWIIRGTDSYIEPDPGPEAIWTHLTRHMNINNVVNQRTLSAERYWAFPFWNYSRLEAGQLLHRGPSGIINFRIGLLQYYNPVRLYDLENLRSSRLQIWAVNGSGYYAHQDLRYIQWGPSTLQNVAAEFLGELEHRAALAGGTVSRSARHHITQLHAHDPHWMIVIGKVLQWRQERDILPALPS
ncbi:hypothetical protein GGR57DRAFT_498601 [Xylariaceae sp. FL1272]|nr:hypothetical protein GGR57DRAFT_498601 [Xylariaceae sp. FL1272]